MHKAMKTGAVSKVSMVINLQIVLGIPITLIANSLLPEIFGEVPSETSVWIVRLIGAALITYGVVVLRSKKGAS